jgi:hypothetical protein
MADSSRNIFSVNYPAIMAGAMLTLYLTEGGSDAIKKTGDHNWDMERMQFQKERGNVSGENDYVNLETTADRVQEAMGSKKGDEPTTSTNKISMPYNKGQKSIEKEKDS